MDLCLRCGTTTDVATIVFGTQVLGTFCPTCRDLYMRSPEYQRMLSAALAEIGSDVSAAAFATAMEQFHRAVDASGPEPTPDNVKRRMSEPPAAD
jgi:hypothetical protein